MKLKIELIPKTVWGKNCRSLLKAKDWNELRSHIYQKNDYKCEICNGQGDRHPVECHEVWKYKGNKQKLVSLESLCPNCHQVKHIGRAYFSAQKSKKSLKHFKKLLKHFRKINKLSKNEALYEINKAFTKNGYRNQINYKTNIKYAKKILKKI